MSANEKELARLLAYRFMQRRDVVAVHTRGHWHPLGRGLKGADIIRHLQGEVALGTYLLDQQDQCRFFTYDLDMNKTGWSYRVDFDLICRKMGDPSTPDDELDGLWPDDPEECNPREVWHDRNHPLRPWLMWTTRLLAAGLAYRTARMHHIPVAVVSSGGKGLHIHAYCGQRPAGEARKMANIVLSSWAAPNGKDAFERKGSFQWRHSEATFDNVTIEVFPKQDSIDGDGLGNLVRLPLGVHPVTKMRSYFIDLTSNPALRPLAELDPIVGLEKGSCS